MVPFEGSPELLRGQKFKVTHKSVQLKAIHLRTHITIVREMGIHVNLEHRVNDLRSLFKKAKGIQPCFCQLSRKLH